MVSSGNLEDIVVGISTAQKFGEKIGIARDVLQAEHHRIRTGFVKVSTNADVVNARDIANVIDVVSNVGNGATRS